MWVPHTLPDVLRLSTFRLHFGTVRLFPDDRFKSRTLRFQPLRSELDEHDLETLKRHVCEDLNSGAAIERKHVWVLKNSVQVEGF